MKLKIAEGLFLSLDAVTQTFLIVGKRGSGKSNTAARLVEQMHHARLPFVVLDPVDTWWGLKAGRGGEKGLDVYVFGGRKADLPLNATDGALIADVLCEHRASMVLSVKHLSGRERSAFMVAFAQTLFQKWGGGPLHVVLEEAHELAPQMAASRGGQQDGEAAMLGAFKRLWKLGRSSGIGGSAITQRPASLSKDITTQSEILIAHRTIGPQDVDAIGQWVKYHGERLDILAELPSLPTGEAFVWAPEFPEGKPIGLQRTSVLLRETYDSASTPKVGETRVEPKELAPVDLERLRAKMSATIEKAKAEDPRELRKQVAELKRQLAVVTTGPTAVKQAAITQAATKTVEKPVLKDGQLRRAEGIVTALTNEVERHERAVKDRLDLLRELTQEIAGAIRQTHTLAPTPPPLANSGPVLDEWRIAKARSHAATGTRPAPRVMSSGDGDLTLKGMRRSMLTALAQHPDGLSKKKILIHTGYASSGPVSTAFADMVRAGWVESIGHGLRITDVGVAALGSYEPLPVGDDLREWLLSGDKLSGMERALLRAICGAYPEQIRKGAVLEQAGYASSGPVSSAFAKLVGLGYVNPAGPALLKAADELFG
ncbi:MAG TPA: DUF87 domain-containing protein [Gemmatimonadaceae bacterium]|nr:DUF87 domain-containing protein [Gemmatimonadaceae bacterium]